MSADQNPLLNHHVLLLVLSELPQLDLLIAQRVCRVWHMAITNSAPLQRALFFRTDLGQAGEETKTNHLLAAHFPDFFTPRFAKDSSLGPFKTSRWCAAVTAEPPNLRFAQAYAHPAASWRRMYSTLPAPHEIQLLTVTEGRGTAFGQFRKLSAIKAAPDAPGRVLPAAGITFGTIYDIVQAGQFPSYAKRFGRNTRVQLTERWMETEDDMQSSALQQFEPTTPPSDDDDVPDPRSRDTFRGLWFLWKLGIGRYREAMPEQNLAGKGCVLVTFHYTPQCKRGGQRGVEYPAGFLKSMDSIMVGEKQVENECYEWTGPDWEVNLPFSTGRRRQR